LRTFNYFDADTNPAYQAFLDDLDSKWLEETEQTRQRRKKCVLSKLLSPSDRGYIVQKIFHLHNKKVYRAETAFTAMNIVDRYLARIGFWNFSRNQACLLSTTAILLAAKIEQRSALNFEHILYFLTEEER
jgi:hypothetical protein